jgi:hypothetical protein
LRLVVAPRIVLIAEDLLVVAIAEAGEIAA